MPDESDPPRKFYQLKPREFERVNPPVPASETASVPVPAPAPVPAPPATESGRIDVADLLRAAQTGGAALNSGMPRVAENDVHAMLRENHARAEAAGLNEVAPRPKRRSRRRRDYLVLLAAGNGFMLGSFLLETFVAYQVQCLAAKMPNMAITLFLQFLLHSPALALPIALMAGFSGALTWLMFGLMDDY